MTINTNYIKSFEHMSRYVVRTETDLCWIIHSNGSKPAEDIDIRVREIKLEGLKLYFDVICDGNFPGVYGNFAAVRSTFRVKWETFRENFMLNFIDYERNVSFLYWYDLLLFAFYLIFICFIIIEIN